MKYITLLLSFFFFNSFGQEATTLNVRGQSELSVQPTQTVITFTIQSINSDYAKTVEELINRVDQLTDELKKINFESDQIKTSQFNINKNFSYDRGQRREDGFIANQTLTVQFNRGKKRLLKVLSTATSSSSEPEIFISFQVDGEKRQEIKQELIKAAVTDAKMKAELIALESGYRLMGIKEINYGINQVGFGAPATYRADFQEVKVINNFEVSDLTYSDSVNIIFLLEKI